MKITSETLPERQVKLEIEVDEERQAQAVERAYKRLAPQVRVPGFRPGKAPRSLIEKTLGKHRLIDEANDILMPEVYKEALDQEDLTPIAQPSVEMVSEEPLVFRATVPLKPEIDLGDMKALQLPREPATFSEDEFTEAMTDLRRRYGTIEPVDRPAQKGDIIRGNVRAETDTGVLFEQNDLEYRLNDESLESLPGMADSLVGKKKGDEFDVEEAVPTDSTNERIAGKTVKYHLKVEEVKEEKLAEEDDDFAKQVGEGFESIQVLRDRIRSDLQEAADNEKLREYEGLIIDRLLEQAKLEYPQVLVEHEIEHILDEQANLNPQTQEAQQLYLARLGKTEQEVRESVREEAESRLKRSLVLAKFAEAENISVEDSEVDEELQRLVLSTGEQGMAILRAFDTEAGRDTLRRSLLSRKTLGRLVEIGSGESAPASAEASSEAAPEAEKESETEPEKPKARRAAPRRAE